jgi:hypothetical protein
MPVASRCGSWSYPSRRPWPSFRCAPLFYIHASPAPPGIGCLAGSPHSQQRQIGGGDTIGPARSPASPRGALDSIRPPQSPQYFEIRGANGIQAHSRSDGSTALRCTSLMTDAAISRLWRADESGVNPRSISILSTISSALSAVVIGFVMSVSRKSTPSMCLKTSKAIVHPVRRFQYIPSRITRC